MSDHWEVIPVGEYWAEQFKSFKAEAFRLEVLQAYGEPSEHKAFDMFLSGRPPGREFIADWCDMVSAHRESGKSMSRVHLVNLPLSDYMKFEIECAYKYTQEAGERIYLLDSSQVPAEQASCLQEDFWLYDDERVMVQEYTPEGRLEHARLTDEPQLVSHYISVKAYVLGIAEPVSSFYLREEGKEL